MNKIFLIFCFFISFGCCSGQKKQAYINAGSKSMNEGDFYNAAVYFNQALEFDEQDENVLLMLAESHRLFNDYTGAAEYYSKYLSSDKKNKNKTAAYYLAEMKKCSGNYAEAKTIFQDYLSAHGNDSDLFAEKSLTGFTSCDTALRLIADSLPFTITNAGNTINTVYSDFGGQMLGDSVIYFSSQRFNDPPKNKKDKPAFISKILKSPIVNSNSGVAKPMDRIFNPSGFLDCNSSISADHKLMIFSRCVSINNAIYHAELYLSKWQNGKWQNPVKIGKEINDPVWTSTQPCIAANGANGYILYFSSDRPGGFGGMDIWKAVYKNDKFDYCENAGKAINSKGNEITPFFDNLTATLYFSSDWYAGLGGYDIFKSTSINNDFSIPVNAGYPLNSSCNDLYFTTGKNENEGLLTSNRPGSMYIHTQTCCYDIYRYEKKESKPVDSLKTVVLDSVSINQKITIKRIADSTSLTLFLPLRLYFDNDEPGKKSLDTTTGKSYDETYFAYISKKEEFINAFNNNKGAKDSIQQKVDDFFSNTIENSYNNLLRFAGLLSVQLKEGRLIRITVQGCASPLAESTYNEKLSKRRISSILNYFQKYEDGVLNNYIQNKQLIIFEDPAGESLASKNVSDNFKDKKKSVYHPDACLERRIAVISIKYDN